jgi:hypothetical protein
VLNSLKVKRFYTKSKVPWGIPQLRLKHSSLVKMKQLKNEMIPSAEANRASIVLSLFSDILPASLDFCAADRQCYFRLTARASAVRAMLSNAEVENRPYFFLGTTAQASISTRMSGKSMPTSLSRVAGLGCCRKSGSCSSKNLYISSRMSNTSSLLLRK